MYKYIRKGAAENHFVRLVLNNRIIIHGHAGFVLSHWKGRSGGALSEHELRAGPICPTKHGIGQNYEYPLVQESCELVYVVLSMRFCD